MFFQVKAHLLNDHLQFGWRERAGSCNEFSLQNEHLRINRRQVAQSTRKTPSPVTNKTVLMQPAKHESRI
jgi:hypothetical protein